MVYSDGKVYGIRWYCMDDKYEKKFPEEITVEQKQTVYQDFCQASRKCYRFAIYTRCYSLMNSDSFYWAWTPIDYADVLNLLRS